MRGKTIKWLAALTAITALALLTLRTPDTDIAEMVRKYGGSEARFIESSVGRIHYRDQGSRTGPVLLLLHGSNSSLQTWEGTVARLKQRYRVISFDLPGHGLTGPNPLDDYSIESAIEAGIAVLDAAKVRQAVWIGNSAGGRTVWRAAIARPDRVAGIVLVDATGARASEPLQLYFGARLARSWLGQELLPYTLPRSVVIASLKQNYANPGRITDAVTDRYWELARFPGNRRAAGIWASASFDDRQWDRIGTIAAPTLLIWGEQDRVVPFSHAQAFAREIRGSRLRIIADAGHLPMEEQPDAFVEVLEPWLDQHWPAQPGR
ncbi:alpha/beta hydrolase [Novosphingobium sp.]|uniref:alpha/beta fold hydrolase n=1 Tax=Novosphingobium sp. TaxID=1874826 RepID=UPI0025CF1E00|nr:alpha/beta hydrolase [Novosphingobium sp.]MCC6926241.1 alpha/beta hydrolase [Novosphingobium sp.]